MHVLRVSFSIWFYSSLFSCVALYGVLSFITNEAGILTILNVIGLLVLLPVHLFLLFLLKELQLTWDTQLWTMNLLGWIILAAIISLIIDIQSISYDSFLKWTTVFFAVGGSCSMGTYVACFRNVPIENKDISPAQI